MSDPSMPHDDALVAAWNSNKTARELVDELGISEHSIRGGWTRLRHLGRIPRGKRKVRSSYFGARADPFDRSDGRPPVGALGWEDDDPLLTRLRAVHGAPRSR
jgi:hypothetical protein